jgi:putative ABC transport system ATP-binding protein
VLSLKDVHREYGDGDATVRALDGVSLDIRQGEFVAFMGPSGSGKSTCLNVLGCLDQPTAGTYTFLGRDVSKLNAEQRALLRRHWLGFVFQSFNLLPRTSALENVELPLVYQGVSASERTKRAKEALAVVGLAAWAHHLPNELSGGQQQRVAMARAIVAQPAVLFADEPTGNLDTTKSHEIAKLLSDLNQTRGLTIVMVTHEEEMAAYASRVVRFRDGRVERDEARTP